MNRIIILIIALTAPAYAQETCGFGTGEIQTRASVTASDTPEIWAYVVIDNRLSIRSGHEDEPCILIFEGEEIKVYYRPDRGSRPDLFQIIAPPGYYADPPEVIVEDRDGVSVPIRYYADLPTG